MLEVRLRSRCKKCVSAAGWVSVSGNLTLAALKWFAGLVCGSQALLADALHSSVDVLGSVVTLIMLKLSRRRPTARYPYGFGKLEDIAAMAIYLILVGAGTFMSVEALHSILTGDIATPAVPALFVAGLSVAINLVMYFFISCAGRNAKSPSLIALGYENRVDALSSVAAMIGILGAILGFAPLDPLAAIVVSTIIVIESLRELWHTARNLTDAALPRSTRVEIERVAKSVPHVKGVLTVRTRRLGGQAQVDLDLLVDSDISVAAAHTIAQAVSDRLKREIEALGEVTVYTHPMSSSSDVRNARVGELIQVMSELKTRRQE